MKARHILFFTLFILSHSKLSECISTYSIDLSSEFIKIAIVIPGVPMEVALNGESQRKTPSVVFIKGDERLFGEPALNMGIKYPKNLYHSITTLIGKTIEHSVVQDFMKNFPYYDILMDDNNQLSFREGKNVYTVEELLGMILENARSIAETYTEMPMKGCVLVLPPFFTQDERLAVLRAANIAGVNVLQLINSNTAVALNYGIFRRKSFNSTVQYYMFYDVGSSATVATIIGYHVTKDADEGLLAESPQLSVVGVGYNQTLGASQFILRIQMHLAKAFNGAKKTKTDVTTVPRSMAKLYKEAARVVKVLSANGDTYAQIENVLDDKDFKMKITRAEFEEMCQDLFAGFSEPVHRALESAQIPMPVIKEIILMGGGTRIPKIQDILLKTSDRSELGKGINTDEAAALGAVYQAAFISPGFKVQKFLIKDSNLVPISVDFLRFKEGTEAGYSTSRLLFDVMNPFPQKKAFTFNKHTTNFDFNVTIGTLDIDRKLLFHVSVDNLTAVYAEYMAPSEKYVTDFKGLKTHFAIDNSGLLSLKYIEAMFDRKWTKGYEYDDSSTLKKIGNTISSFFGASENKEDKKEVEDDGKSKVEDKGEQKEGDSGNKTESDAKGGNATAANTTLANGTDTPKNESTKPKTEVLHQTVHFVSTWKSFDIPSEAVAETYRERSLALKAVDDQKMALEKAKNELESYIFDVKSRFEKDVYERCSTEAERSAVLAEAEKAGDWYEDQGQGTGREEYTAKYTGLASLMRDIDLRVKEFQGRPDAIGKLNAMLNTSNVFLVNLYNVSGEGPGKIFTLAEYDSLSRLINDTTKWFRGANKTFESTKLYENPTVLISDFEPHMRALEREVGYLLNKINIWKNQTPPPPPPSSDKTNDSTTKEQPSNKSQTPDETAKPDTEDKDKTQSTKIVTDDQIPPVSDKEGPHTDL